MQLKRQYIRGQRSGGSASVLRAGEIQGGVMAVALIEMGKADLGWIANYLPPNRHRLAQVPLTDVQPFFYVDVY